MLINQLELKNWRNFAKVNVALQRRQFIVGPNASGKSNLLDAFRFLHDIAKQKGGGLQEAIEKRGGLSKIRCLSARRDTEVSIGISISESEDAEIAQWQYELGIRQEPRGSRLPYVSYEKVWEKGKQILDRPNAEDKKDSEQLKQTYLEQVTNNEAFREIGRYFEKISYMHLVPQLLRYSNDIQGRVLEDDPFGQGFLEQITKTNSRIRNFRFKQINEIIKVAVPKLQSIDLERDEITGKPHLNAICSHWRPQGAKQREDQFSDGTLRLIALIWSLLGSGTMLLLEEPELSLHSGVVEKLTSLLHRAQNQTKQQTLISTHSANLLSDPGIGAEEILLLEPADEGTKANVASDLADVVSLLETGISVGEAVIPRTKPNELLRQTDDGGRGNSSHKI